MCYVVIYKYPRDIGTHILCTLCEQEKKCLHVLSCPIIIIIIIIGTKLNFNTTYKRCAIYFVYLAKKRAHLFHAFPFAFTEHFQNCHYSSIRTVFGFYVSINDANSMQFINND